MRKIAIFFVIAAGVMATMMAGCGHAHKHEAHEHDENMQLTAYNDLFEVYAEVSPLVANEAAEVVAHFTWLRNFKPLETGTVTVTLTVGGKTVSQTMEKPAREGIYKFSITPSATGIGQLSFEIVSNDTQSVITVPNVTVYSDAHEAQHAAADAKAASSNGDFVRAGQTMAVVMQNRDLFVKAEIQPKYYPMLSEIASAIFRNPVTGVSYSLEELGGQLVSYGKFVDLQRPLLPVLFRIDNTKDWIPGSFVELFIRTQGSQPVITVPCKAVLEEMGNHFVYVQLTPEYFEKRQVNIGRTDGINTEITSGLSGSERVVVNGAVLVKIAQSAGGLDAESGHQH